MAMFIRHRGIHVCPILSYSLTQTSWKSSRDCYQKKTIWLRLIWEIDRLSLLESPAHSFLPYFIYYQICTNIMSIMPTLVDIFQLTTMPNFSIQGYDKHTDQIKLITLKFYEWALDNKINSLKIVIADQHYYEKTLEQRVEVLGTLSTEFLCKTIVFENTGYNEKYQGQFYPKYIAVMVQYIAKINTEKLNKEMKNYHQKNTGEKAGKQYFHYRLVQEKESQEMTGYEHNAVVPVLMKTKMPIIFSHEIQNLKPQFFWMGGGHGWIKIRVSLQDFKRSYEDKVFVMNITN